MFEDSKYKSVEETKREVRSFLVARDPSIDRRFRPRPERSVRLFADVEEGDEDSTSVSSASEDTNCYTISSVGDGDGALVYLRLRPVSNPSSAYTLSESGNKLITAPCSEIAGSSKNNMEKHYSFTEIFTGEVQQGAVYEKCIGKKIEAEENFTVLTYGTSGSGKTFTLLGTEEYPGIIHRSMENIFTVYASNIYPQPSIKIVNAKATFMDDISIAKEMLIREQIMSTCADMNAQHRSIHQHIQEDHNFETQPLTNTSVFIWVSFVEIYNELVYDLLEPPRVVPQKFSNNAKVSRKNLKIMGNEGKVFIKGLTSVYVTNSLEALKVLRYGLQKVNYASTSINANSSRSHCVFMVDVLKFMGTGEVTECTYKFCDLAGSERLDKTGNTGSRLKEAQRINTSLLVLGRCLDAVNAATRKRNIDVIPFRESKLTMLLQSALLGKEKLTMIVNVAPTDSYYEENLNVLGFSSIAQNIIYKKPVIKENKARYSWVINQSRAQTNDTNLEAMELREEVCRLRSEIEQMKLAFENELAVQEQQLRSELVDLFRQDHEDQKRLLQEKLEAQKCSYEKKIELLKAKYEEELEYLRNSSEDDETPQKKRRTLE